MNHEEQEPLRGTTEAVIRQIMDSVAEGTMTQAQASELIIGLNHTITHHRHDVSVGFRVALIAQGYEHYAIKMADVHMTLTGAGAMFEYGISSGYEPDWLDHIDEEGEAAMLKACVFVLRGGNVNASVSPEGKEIIIDGTITTNSGVAPDDVEALISEFVKELDDEFPDKPPPRKGEWW